MRWSDLTPRQAQHVRRVGYVVFTGISFLVFFYLLFPSQRCARLVEGLALTHAGVNLSIGDLRPSFFLGVSAEDVRIVTREPTPAGKKEDSEPIEEKGEMSFERVDLQLGFWKSIFGGLAADIDFEGLGGQGNGRVVAEDGGLIALNFEVRQLDTRKIPPLQDLGLPIVGRVDAKAEISSLVLRRNNLDPSKANGHFTLSCAKCAVGDGKAKIKVPGNPMLAMGIVLPRVRLGSVDIEADLKRGLVSVRKGSARSADLQLGLEGGIQLRYPLKISMLDSYLTIRLTPELKKRDSKFEAVEMALAQGRRPDLSFGLRIRGFINRPRAQPAKEGIRRKASASTRLGS